MKRRGIRLANQIVYCWRQLPVADSLFEFDLCFEMGISKDDARRTDLAERGAQRGGDEYCRPECCMVLSIAVSS
ncbi:MAG: hypothetical protein ABIV39_13430 [Verrucomicrobiota bacterium]